MKNKQKSRADKATRAVREFLEDPAPDIDLDEHFAGINRTASRAALVDQLRYGSVSFLTIHTFEELVGYLGISDQLPALRQIVSDRSLELDRRAIAVSLLEDEEPGSGTSLLDDEADRVAVMRALWRGLIHICLEDADAIEAVTGILTSTDDDAFFRFVDGIRRDSGAPAALIYAEALADPEASVYHERIIEALVAEPSIGSLELVEHLEKTLPFEREKQRHRAAAMRIRTALVESTTREGERGGSMTPMTRGGGMLRFWFRAPGGNRVCVDTIFEAGGRIRVPMIMPSIPDETFEREEEPTDAAIPFEQAASLFLTLDPALDSGLDRSALALARTIAHVDLPPAAPPAVAAARRSANATPGRHAPASPAFTDAELAQLLATGGYAGWHFIPEADADDEFDPDDPSEREKQQFLKRIAANDGVVETLRWMCDYQSRWHFARGEERESAIMARLAIDVPSNFAKNPLPKLLLERTLGMWIPEDEYEAGDDFDESVDELDDEMFPDAEESRKRIREITLVAVDEQLHANTPPAARRALVRLKSLGYSEKDAKAMLAEALAVEMFTIIRENVPPDPARLERRYDALPEPLDLDA